MKKILLIVVILFLLVTVGGGIYYLMSEDDETIVTELLNADRSGTLANGCGPTDGPVVRILLTKDSKQENTYTVVSMYIDPTDIADVESGVEYSGSASICTSTDFMNCEDVDASFTFDNISNLSGTGTYEIKMEGTDDVYENGTFFVRLDSNRPMCG